MVRLILNKRVPLLRFNEFQNNCKCTMTSPIGLWTCGGNPDWI